MNDKSIIVCLNCSNFDKINENFDIFDKLILKNSLEKDSYLKNDDENCVLFCPFVLDTKYYTVSLNLCKLVRPSIVNKNFADHVEAVILHFDPAYQKFDRVQMYFKTFVADHWQPSVRMLYVNPPLSRDQEGDRQSLVEWCVEKEFELIESDAPDEEARLEAKENRELFGVDRVMQILRAHTWSDLVMKDEKFEKEERAKRLSNYLNENSAVGKNGEGAAPSLTEGAPAHAVPAVSSWSRDNIDIEPENDQDGSSFEQLFAKFSAFKTTADSLLGEEKKIFAAKIALDFYKSIGGSDDENGHVIFSSEEEAD